MDLDLTLEDTRWGDLSPLAEQAVAAVLTHLGIASDICEVSLLACDDARIGELNAAFRGKATPTNVLSWPSVELASDRDGGTPARPEPDFTGEIALGDIAISYDTCAREAEAVGKALQDHVTHLVVHGMLHLLGYDHVRDGDATLMEGLEVEILGKLGLDNPYNEFAGPDGPRDLEQD
ncbi:rRNA maturation RNase YbeY [Ruegeria sp. 2012CJ41-6]|uniref:Endoribonuclease YbeY n=1 Tax=Ruegeria spongiae TaxID=2942209 RepID=A0ABT0Q4G4_9RHOB|nr:rRNA maturation RNase YbeY [Ruegeria spongiae]MCL6283804.1 rRNA maturation RNase YbeY [Ruegeria spongiae]